MIADTTFLIHWLEEMRASRIGPVRTFLARHRSELTRTTIISVAEASVSFPSAEQGWAYFQTRRWAITGSTTELQKAQPIWIANSVESA